MQNVEVLLLKRIHAEWIAVKAAGFFSRPTADAWVVSDFEGWRARARVWAHSVNPDAMRLPRRKRVAAQLHHVRVRLARRASGG